MTPTASPVLCPTWQPVCISTRTKHLCCWPPSTALSDILREQASSSPPQTSLAARGALTLQDPVIRQAMMIDLKEAVLIFDEAHNIEDVCRWVWPSCTVSGAHWRCTAYMLAISLWGRWVKLWFTTPPSQQLKLPLHHSDSVLYSVLASHQLLGCLRQASGVAAHTVSSRASHHHLKVSGQVCLPDPTACKERLLLPCWVPNCEP